MVASTLMTKTLRQMTTSAASGWFLKTGVRMEENINLIDKKSTIVS